MCAKRQFAVERYDVVDIHHLVNPHLRGIPLAMWVKVVRSQIERDFQFCLHTINPFYAVIRAPMDSLCYRTRLESNHFRMPETNRKVKHKYLTLKDLAKSIS
jgi:hypothetical protein